MKKYFLLIVFLAALSLNANCQTPTENDVASAVENLLKGFVDADKDLLDKMTAEELI